MNILPKLAPNIALLAAILFFSASAHATELTSPRGGWNYSGLTDKSGESRVAYPTPPINRGAQKHRRMIEGHIREAGNQRGAKLVVNGNPMALDTGADGRFQRYYAFGGGSNSVEVRSASGKESKRVQFYEANPGQQSPQLRIVCSWDAPEAEIDLHIVTPDGQHAFFAQPVLDGGGGLDVDSVDGPGPEMFTTIAPRHGAYHVYVNYWGSYGPGGYNFDDSVRQKPIVTARITLVYYENTAKEKRESFVIPLRRIGELTLVKSFMF
ncbi:uncharacterized protein YfaP (DUF2135 family) [Paucimonas lemoignei]|uniref:Uncharacterized protein YfaP (DUF2135 family) n=1 Tax=Paucimonas lemoignei TaxID=29443 RepID=A0A4R3HYI5_PAULE|nr:DUF2135 domain-containing protein [Paucimonas lemoignei]TCS38272.1 uncharacterized protein YfaP (DUF2135 family) [Paucimonas lemoignei]